MWSRVVTRYKNYRDFVVSLGIALLDYAPSKIGVGFSNHNRELRRIAPPGAHCVFHLVRGACCSGIRGSVLC